MNTADVWSAGFREKLVCALRDHAPNARSTEPHLESAIRESVGHPGKLVRPSLAYASMLAHRADEGAALDVAAAVEFFHIASLLLDDLPCMDDATTRRGHPCVHRVHGEATAILAALAFINRAYALLGFALAPQPGLVRVRAQACVDACLGTAGLVGGQARDLRFAESTRSAREVSQIAVRKTGALLSLSLLLPAQLADPDSTEQRALGSLCLYWSLAFQVLDDVQDVLSNEVASGKTTGRDTVLDRPNLARVLGVPAARRRASRLLGQAQRTIERLTAGADRWDHLLGFQRFFVRSAAPWLGHAEGAAA